MNKPAEQPPEPPSPPEGMIYYNGDFVESAALRLPHTERGFLYGDGLFETIRAYNGKLFRAKAHAERMLQSAAALGIACEFPTPKLAQICQQTCDRNIDRLGGELYLRATLTRGCGYGPDLTLNYTPNLLVYVKPLPEPEAQLYAEGITAIISSEPRAAGSLVRRHKTVSYLDYLLARREAHRQGAGEAIILDTDGMVLEGACSNLFIVKDNTLITPDTDLALLPGITRAVVLESAAKLGIASLTTAFPAAELLAADEVFLTNSIQEILPVVEVGGKKLGQGKPGEVTRKLLTAYREEVSAACA